MLTALLRKAWADVAGRPLQTGLVFAIVVAATGILAAAVTTQVSVDRAYLTRHEESNDAHVWFRTTQMLADPSALERIGDMKEVTATSGLVADVSRFPAVLDKGVVDLKLIGRPSVLPEVGRPIITSGRWRGPGGDREIVLDHGLARDRGIEIGDRLEILRGGGSETFEVVGLAVVAGLSYPHTYSDSTPYASAYVLPSVLETMEPDRSKWVWRYGVRIQDPEAAGQFARDIWWTYPEDQKPSFTTWQAERDDLNEVVRLYAVFIGLFGLFAVGVAGFVIVNVVAGNVLVQLRDVGLLKSVGFTPWQVTALLLAEHAGTGVPATVVGAAIGYAATPLVLRVTGGLLGTPVAPVFDLPLMGAIVLGVSLAIAATVLAPAWAGGRVSTVRALNSGPSRPPSRASRAARLAVSLRLPAVAVVGLKDAFNRPVRSALTVAALTGAVIITTFGLGVEATLHDVVKDPRLTGGAPYQVTVARRQGAGEMSPAEVRALLDSRPEIDSYYGWRGFVGDVEDSSGAPLGLNKVHLGALDEDHATLAPYMLEGRLFAGPGETIITRRLAQERGLGLTDDFTFVIDGALSRDLDLDGSELNLRVIGTYVGDNLEARTSLDTVRQQLDLDTDSTAYGIKVADGSDLEAFRIALLRQANDRLQVTVTDDYETSEKTAGYIRPPLYALTIALVTMGAAGVLITLLFTVRERHREFGILKTLGFTPRQIMASVASGSILLAAVALIVGVPLGLGFTRLSLNFIGIEAGVGAPWGTMPGPGWIALLIPLFLLTAVLGAALPARRAAGITVREALRSE